jgi:polysaccharide pyruvyl transferase WcaK-like protein
MSLRGAKVERDAPRLVNIANFSRNAGDTLVPVTVRDAIDAGVGPARWQARHAHRIVDDRMLALLNRSQGIVIGGGGLFLRDTNANTHSGWQWSCSLEQLRRIERPIAIFAVGYNRFRGHEEFAPIFAEHLTAVTDRSIFVGLRNRGSIEAVKRYIPDSLHHKLRFQPCATTLAKRLYPDLAPGVVRQSALPDDAPIVLNCAFDRIPLRYGPRQEQISSDIAQAALTLEKRAPLRYYSHLANDDPMLAYLADAGVRFEHWRLYEKSPQEILRAYAEARVTIGMRGHAQMIPFGCGRPIVSLVSHDKMWYFLDDIGARDWGVEVDVPDLASQIVATVEKVLSDECATVTRIERAQDELWRTTMANVADLAAACGI